MVALSLLIIIVVGTLRLIFPGAGRDLVLARRDHVDGLGVAEDISLVELALRADEGETVLLTDEVALTLFAKLHLRELVDTVDIVGQGGEDTEGGLGTALLKTRSDLGADLVRTLRAAVLVDYGGKEFLMRDVSKGAHDGRIIPHQ